MLVCSPRRQWGTCPGPCRGPCSLTERGGERRSGSGLGAGGQHPWWLETSLSQVVPGALQLKAIRDSCLAPRPHTGLWGMVFLLQFPCDLQSLLFEAYPQAPSPFSILLSRTDTKIFLRFLWKNPGRSAYDCSRAAHICAQFSWNSWKPRHWSWPKLGAHRCFPISARGAQQSEFMCL